MNSPGDIGGFPEAAAGKKTSDSADSQCEHQGNGNDIEIFSDGQLVVSQIKQNSDKSKQAAELLKAAIP